MQHDLEQTTQLVTQLQQAHRLAAGFYQRILPLFDQIASQALDAEFWYWEPSENSPPAAREHVHPAVGHGTTSPCSLLTLVTVIGMAIRPQRTISLWLSAFILIAIFAIPQCCVQE